MTGKDLPAFLVPLPPTLNKKNKNSQATGESPCSLQETNTKLLLAVKRVLPLQS